MQYACLPWRHHEGRLEFLLITSRGTRRWVLPKGWPMIGIEPAVAAAQEAFEEAGVVGATGESIGRYAYNKLLNSGEVRALEVEVYPLHATIEYADWQEMAERERAWLPREEAAASVDEPELARIILNFAPL